MDVCKKREMFQMEMIQAVLCDTVTKFFVVYGRCLPLKASRDSAQVIASDLVLQWHYSTCDVNSFIKAFSTRPPISSAL